MPKDERDERRTRCRRLGHEVPLHYCRTQEGHSVCPLVRDCWWQQMDIDDYLRSHLTEQELAALASGQPPPPRLTRIIEEAMKARD